jgi:serine/threonine protein kinase
MESLSSYTSEEPTATLGRRALARTIAADIARRWDYGDPITEEQAIFEHPDIAPELVEELHAARSIRSALLSARRAGDIAQPLRIMSLKELEAPIEIPDDKFTDQAWDELPKIDGYIQLGLIRRGGQAIVYKGVQEATGRTVAIKVMNGGGASLSRHRIRFDREVQILARLNHRNIVSIIDRGRSACGSFLLVMEHVAGPELDEYCRLRVPRDEQGTRRLLQIFIKIAAAVDVAHHKGIVHRDLKPSNIRIDEHGEPRLLDFGLASLSGQDSGSLREATLSGQIVGSIPWASPEQIAGTGDVGALSDVYSLGVILYQTLAGRFPYVVDGPLHEAFSNIATTQPPAPSGVPGARRFKGDRAVDAIILKSLAKDPQLRYPSAGALSRDLECVLEGRKPSVGAKSPRKLLYLAASGLLAVLLSAICWFAAPSSAPKVTKLPVFVNSVGMHLVHLPPGRVVLNQGAGQKYFGESVAELPGFSIANSEVTQRQFEDVMGFNPSDRRWIGADLPVQNVSWDEAVTFCEKLSTKDHCLYRLPTNAQWLYAARAGGARDPGRSELEHFGWFIGNSSRKLHPVCQLWPNAYGLYDMYGGVAEFILDRLGSKIHRTCGGGFLNPTAESRYGLSSGVYSDARHPDVGFRVVLIPPQN